jgi:hypothetical protein
VLKFETHVFARAGKFLRELLLHFHEPLVDLTESLIDLSESVVDLSKAFLHALG